MSLIVPEGNKLRLSEKFSRLGTRMKDPEWRRYFKLIALGKFLGLAILLTVMAGIAYWMRSATSFADTPATMPAMAATMPATAPAAVDPYASIKIADHVNEVSALMPAIELTPSSTFLVTSLSTISGEAPG